MSKIEQLIQELCPGGVECTKLGQIMMIVRGASPRPIQNFMSTEGDGIPWIKIGDVRPEDKYIESTKEFITREGVKKSRFLRKGDFILSNSMSFGRPYILKIDGCIHDGWIAMSSFEQNLLPDYLYEVLKSDSVQNYWRMKANNGGAMTNLNADIVRDTVIPLPPLPIQQEIVRIMDTFTEAQANLEQELELRKKQYEYYRNHLLTFDENDPSVKWMTISSVFDSRNGYTPSTSNKEFWEDGDIPWFKMEDIRDNGRILKDSANHINKIAVKGKGLFKANSIIVATSATIGEHALILVGHLSNQRFTNLYPKKDFEDIVNMKFAYYYMFLVDEWCKGHVKQGGFASVDMSGFYNLEYPVPSKERQQEIVSILDKFESAIQTLEEELALRKKQYEYYREKLLTFN